MHNSSNEHLHCPWCQYDLYGLPTDGNIVRCPECGNRSDLRLLRMPREKRQEKVRRMESLPSACTLLAFLVACFALLGMIALTNQEPDYGVGVTFAGLVVASAAGWVACVRLYLRRYRFVLGAVRVLLLFHVCLCLFIAGTQIILLGGCGSIASGRPDLGMFAYSAGIATLILGGLLYKGARANLASMHHQLVGRGIA